MLYIARLCLKKKFINILFPDTHTPKKKREFSRLKSTQDRVTGLYWISAGKGLSSIDLPTCKRLLHIISTETIGF